MIADIHTAERTNARRTNWQRQEEPHGDGEQQRGSRVPQQWLPPDERC
jgi:hypothetical protein